MKKPSELFHILFAGSKPCPAPGGFQDHRHPVVNRGKQFVRFSCDDGAGADFGSIRTHPMGPEAGKTKRPLRFQTDVIGNPPPPLFFPFIKSIREDKTPPVPERDSETGFIGKCFLARIDHPISDRRVLRPRRDEPPTKHFQLRRGGGSQDRDTFRWSDIEMRTKLPEPSFIKLKILRHLSFGSAQRISSAHELNE